MCSVRRLGVLVSLLYIHYTPVHILIISFIFRKNPSTENRKTHLILITTLIKLLIIMLLKLYKRPMRLIYNTYNIIPYILGYNLNKTCIISYVITYNL